MFCSFFFHIIPSLWTFLLSVICSHVLEILSSTNQPKHTYHTPSKELQVLGMGGKICKQENYSKYENCYVKKKHLLWGLEKAYNPIFDECGVGSEKMLSEGVKWRKCKGSIGFLHRSNF